ncbi:MAG: esterase [Bacteroidales bacterium]|nr:esterase [Candidatus Cacconaster equi]
MKKLTVCLLGLVLTLSALAQNARALPPQINEDNSVTLTCKAPEAKLVQVVGELSSGQSTKDMVRDTNGIWSYTTAPLESEMYYYLLKIDGVSVTDPINSACIIDGGSHYSYVIVPGGVGDLYIPQQVPHGSVHKVWYTSKGLGYDRRMAIYTPPGYEQSKKKYPVLYLLHGSGGNEESWLTFGRTAQIMDNLLAQGRIEPMIVVMTSGATKSQAAPGECPGEGLYSPVSGSSYDTSYEVQFQDVLDYVESSFRVIRKKSGRAIAGLSMGGEQAFQTALNYPDTFDYVGIFSGVPRVREIKGNELKVEIYQNTLEKLNKEFQNGLQLYYIAVGVKDSLYGNSKWLRETLDAKGYPYVYNESEGGHSWRNWRLYLTDFTQKLFK